MVDMMIKYFPFVVEINEKITGHKFLSIEEAKKYAKWYKTMYCPRSIAVTQENAHYRIIL
jgi:hypothetical protein